MWIVYNDKDRLPETDATTQAIFDQGHEVGALAKLLYPGGIEVSAGATDFDQVIQTSLEAAKARKPLFEAGFVYNDGFARVDILNPVGNDAWDIVEVKSSTEIKDVYLLDLAFQGFVYTGAGLKIRRSWDPNGFLTVTDVTKEVSGLSQDIQPQLVDMFAVRRRSKPSCRFSQARATTTWKSVKAGRQVLSSCGSTSVPPARPNGRRFGGTWSGTAARTPRA